jgi:hypothetical protein
LVPPAFVMQWLIDIVWRKFESNWSDSHFPRGDDFCCSSFPFFFFGQKSGRNKYGHDDRDMRPQGLIEPTFLVRSCDLQLSRCIANRRRWFGNLITCQMQFGLGLYRTSFGNEMSSDFWLHGEKVEIFIMTSFRRHDSFSKLFECESLWEFKYPIGQIWSMFISGRKMNAFHDCDGELSRPEVPFRPLIVLSADYALHWIERLTVYQRVKGSISMWRVIFVIRL